MYGPAPHKVLKHLFEKASERAARPLWSSVDTLRDAERMFEINTKVSHCAVDLCVTEQQLDGSQIASLAIYFRGLCPAQLVRTVAARLQANRGHPIAYNSAVRARRYVWPVVEATEKYETAREHLRRFDTDQHRLTLVFRQLELNRTFGLALDHGNTFPYSVLFCEVAHLKFDQIAAAQFAVDSDVEQGKVSQALALPGSPRPASATQAAFDQ